MVDNIHVFFSRLEGQNDFTNFLKPPFGNIKLDFQS